MSRHSASNWTPFAGDQGPVYSEIHGRILHIKFNGELLIKYDVMTGKVNMRRIGVPSKAMKNFFTRFLELAHAERYAVTLEDGCLFLTDKIKRTKQMITHEGVLFTLPNKSLVYILSHSQHYGRVGHYFGAWASMYESNRQSATTL